jgi:hypothetical protein
MKVPAFKSQEAFEFFAAIEGGPLSLFSRCLRCAVRI